MHRRLGRGQQRLRLRGLEPERRPPDGQELLLGRELTYTRRRPTSECFNGEQYERKVVKTPCECAEVDYECEFGFRRKVESTVCEHMGQFVEGTTCGSNGFVVLDAHRKVPGNGCTGGFTPLKATVPCSSPSNYGRVLLYGLLFLVCLLGGSTALSNSAKYKSLFFNSGMEAFRDIQYAAIGTNAAGGYLGKADEDEFLDDRSGDADVMAYTRGGQPLSSVPTHSLSDDEAPEPVRGLDTAAANVPRLAGPPASGADLGGDMDLL